MGATVPLPEASVDTAMPVKAGISLQLC